MKLSEILEDKRVSMGIAKALSPFDTGNLRFNAIKSELTADGFRIRYSLGNAYYIYFLEEGTSKSTRHMGFIANRTVPMIASYMSAKYKQMDSKLTKEFIYKSNLAEQDRNYNYIEREQRNLYSKQLDIDKLSKINDWQHNTEIEIYDDDFESRRL